MAAPPPLLRLDRHLLHAHVLRRLPTPALGALACSCTAMRALANGPLKRRMHRCIWRMDQHLLAAYKRILHQMLMLHIIHQATTGPAAPGLATPALFRRLRHIQRFWAAHPLAADIAREVRQHRGLPCSARTSEHTLLMAEALREYDEPPRAPDA